MKKSHENEINSLLYSPLNNSKDVETLKQFIYCMAKYDMPLLSLEYMAKSLPSSVHINFLGFGYFFDNFVKDNRDRYPFDNSELNDYFRDFKYNYLLLTDKIDGFSINDNLQYQNFIPIDGNNKLVMNKHKLSTENINNLNREIEELT